LESTSYLEGGRNIGQNDMRSSKDIFIISLVLTVTLGVALSYGVYSVIKLFIFDSLDLLFAVHETLYGKVSFLITTLFIVIGFPISLGLFTLKDVFRKLIVIISFLNLGFGLIDYSIRHFQVHADTGSPSLLVLDLLTTGFLIWFFSTERVRKQFQTAKVGQ
jgi:hypothetical protein